MLPWLLPAFGCHRNEADGQCKRAEKGNTARPGGDRALGPQMGQVQGSPEELHFSRALECEQELGGRQRVWTEGTACAMAGRQRGLGSFSAEDGPRDGNTESGAQRWDHVPAPVGVLAGPSEVSMKAAPCPADTARQYYVFSFSEPVSWTLELWVPAMLFFHPAALTNLPPVHPHCSPYYPQPKRRVGKIKRNS